MTENARATADPAAADSRTGQPGTTGDARAVVRSATGSLRTWNLAGILEPADVHVAMRLGDLGGETGDQVLLAVALVVRAARNGSTCLDLAQLDIVPAATPGEGDPGLPEQPDAATWTKAVSASRLCAAGGPLQLDGSLLYLDRYWQEETQVCHDVLDRVDGPGAAPDPARLDAALERLFGSASDSTAEAGTSGTAAAAATAGTAGTAAGTGWRADTAQRHAARVAANGRLTVVAGGPGTGKTTTVARLLAVLADRPGPRPRIALAAPSGKAAARLTEAVRAETALLPAADRDRLGDLPATTLHRLLGWKPGSSTRFRHDRDNRLPHDIVVVDEASMVSLTMMARLLEALRPQAGLVLVGDPDQLASVDAGAVLADLVQGLAGDRSGAGPGDRRGVVRLDRVHRFGGAIAELATAVREGDADAALAVLDRGDPAVSASEDGLRADVVDAAVAIRAAAGDGDLAAALRHLQQHRLVCGHRLGPNGVEGWTRRITHWLFEDAGLVPDGEWYLGRPLLITQNDYGIGLFNGDTGVVVRGADGSLRAAFDSADGAVDFAPTRLGALETVHAMTVHRSQGSQFDRVTVSLPDLDSPLLTRELLYTAVTRAQRFVRVLGTPEQVAAAVRRPASRATGLQARLAGPAG